MENVFTPVTMLTITETAEAFNLPVHFIRRLCLTNQIVFVKSGKKFLVNKEKFVSYLNNPQQEKGR